MELGLRLGDGCCMRQKEEMRPKVGLGLGFSVGLGLGFGREGGEKDDDDHRQQQQREKTRCSDDPPVQLSLLSPAPVQRLQQQLSFPWTSDTRSTEASVGRGFDVNRMPAAEDIDATAGIGPTFSPGSNVGPAFNSGPGITGEFDRSSSRNSDEEENAAARKKLRLSKEQSAFLEESFKEHHTLNPKQKLALAKQLNLRPRQVEVWFQNRRARTKLKQTEVDCEYLKRCCETLTEENRRLHKELAELRALKATPHPFFSHLPATTLSMCPSCERVAQSTTNPSNATVAGSSPSAKNGNPVPAVTTSAAAAAAAVSECNNRNSQSGTGLSKPVSNAASTPVPGSTATTPFMSVLNSPPLFFPSGAHTAPPRQPSTAS